MKLASPVLCITNVDETDTTMLAPLRRRTSQILQLLSTACNAARLVSSLACSDRVSRRWMSASAGNAHAAVASEKFAGSPLSVMFTWLPPFSSACCCDSAATAPWSCAVPPSAVATCSELGSAPGAAPVRSRSSAAGPCAAAAVPVSGAGAGATAAERVCCWLLPALLASRRSCHECHQGVSSACCCSAQGNRYAPPSRS